MDNPLASRRPRPATAPPDPLLRHAQLWQHVNNQTSEILRQHVVQTDYILPVLGALAGDPDVTAKDVIKAVTSAVAEGKMDPSKAVANIADMPADPDKLRPWVKDRYATALATTVHAKAALLRQAPAPQAPQAAPVGAAPAASAPTPMPQGAQPEATVQ